MKFRIWAILWAFALFASAMATFGTAGFVVALIVGGLWSHYFLQKQHVVDKSLVLAAIWIVLLVPTLVFPLSERHINTLQCASCRNNMKQLALAVLTYEEARNEYPAYSQKHRDSKHEHSWRTRVIPQLESTDFFDRFNVDEPWDSPNNVKVVAQYQYENVFQCPSYRSDTNDTHYFAIVGERTMWPPDRGRKLSEITDGTSNTILLIEAPHKQIPWAKPEDISFDEAVELLTSPPTEEYGHEYGAGFFYKPVRGIHVAFADGSVQLFELPISKAAAEALLTVDGGEPIDPDNLTAHHRPQLNYARIYSLSVFVLLSMSPIFNLGKRSKSRTTDNATG